MRRLNPLDKHEEHAKVIYDSLAAGWTIAQAVEEANKTKLPSGISSSLKMVVKGDDYARLINVYLNATEALAHPLVVNSWYWIKN